MPAETQPPAKGLIRRFRFEIILTGLFILHTILFALCGVITFARMTVSGIDPVCYYSYLRSVVFDHDLNFENEYRVLDPTGVLLSYPLTPAGRRPNSFAVGPAIACAPLFLMSHVIVKITRVAPADGFSPPYQVSCFLTLALFALAGLLLLFRWVRLFFSPMESLLATAAAWFASAAVYYAYPATFMPHAISAFFVTLFLYYAQKTRGRGDALRWAMAGVLIGAMALMRWQDCLFALFLLPDMKGLQRRQLIRNASITAITALLIFLPQTIVWSRLYGRPFLIPQGGSFLLWSRPMLMPLLFSTFNGLFTWTPITLFGMLGLILWLREKAARPLPQLLLILFILQAYMNSIVRDWHGSWGFGMRRFIDCTPLFAAGLGALLTRIRPKFRLILPGAVLSLFILWNYLFLIQYYFHLVAWNRPLTFHEMVGDKFHILASIERRRLVRTAYLSAQRGYMDDAEKAINLAIEIDPLHSDIYFAAGEIAASQNETDRAFRFLMQARALAPGDRDIERAIKKLGEISRMTIGR